MRPLAVLGIYLLVVFLGAALLSPVAYMVGQSAGAETSLAAVPFHRYFQRCLLVLSAAGLWPLARALRIRTLADFGFEPWAEGRKRLVGGFLLGFAMLGFACALSILLNARVIARGATLPALAGPLMLAASTAGIVGFMEELFFRGLIFKQLRRDLPFLAAVLLSSLFYAWVHYFGVVERHIDVGWADGFRMLGQMAISPFTLERSMPAFINLVLAGVILALACVRTGGLCLAIGIHAGWIFWLRFYNVLTDRVGRPDPFWGTGKLIDGWFSTVLLAAVCLCFVWATWRRKTP